MEKLLCLLLAFSSAGVMANETQTLLAKKNFIVTTTINRVFNPPVPVVTPLSPANPGAHKAELFSVSLTVPEHVSRITIYPTYDESMGYGRLRNTTNPEKEFIQYEMVDKDGNRMMKEGGVDVLANETVVFTAINNRFDEVKVSPGTYKDQLMVGYYVN
ncbi:TPA: Cro/Cl family transcriptional regulator [Salmonella enterica]|nr:Cro/Cl family transcriptional regulator [Salmonella enterica]